MRKHILQPSISLLAAVLLASVMGKAFAQDKQHVEKQVTVTRGDREDIPGLSDQQKEQVKKIRLETQKAMLPLESQIEVKSAELKSLLVSDNPGTAAVNAKLEEIGSLRTQMQKKRVAQQLDIRRLLTPDQRVAFDERLLKGFDRMHEGMREGMGRGRGQRWQQRRGGGFEEAPLIEKEEKVEIKKE
jgi:Spy/CpxP family protein refolding chaperone